ncbi:hypothetical protein DPMN_029980 [Dreissena polymorpha]|uniref:Uncharacterized protein n=1 Tax=Dreissena polymorpha TaxID=45954 RepID=A0A9D4LXD7_DREPO|nr:hypothetical protein DPMN_029980 [Dreissena polymorpha]
MCFNGGVIEDDEGKKKRWIEYFQELLNKPALAKSKYISPALAIYLSCAAHPQRERSATSLNTSDW